MPKPQLPQPLDQFNAERSNIMRNLRSEMVSQAAEAYIANPSPENRQHLMDMLNRNEPAPGHHGPGSQTLARLPLQA